MFRCEGAVLEAHDISNGHFHADGLTQHWITEKIKLLNMFYGKSPEITKF